MIIEYLKKHLFNIIFFFLLIVICAMLSFLIVYEIKYKKVKAEVINNDISVINDNENLDEEEYIFIDIKGSVKKPNVYKLTKGSRTIDAINASGGLTKTANTRFINLSKVLNDGDVIVIYSNDEIKKAQKQQTI